MGSQLKEIVSLSANGDEKAISELIVMHKKLLVNIIYRVILDWQASLDICQETFISAFKNIKKLKEPEKFKSWICKIALNLAKNELKKRRNEEEYRRTNFNSYKLEIGNPEKRKSIIINEALQKLKLKDRFVLSMYYYQGFSLREIADLTGLKEDNVKMILSRARKKLREKLEGYEYELLS